MVDPNIHSQINHSSTVFDQHEPYITMQRLAILT